MLLCMFDDVRVMANPVTNKSAEIMDLLNPQLKAQVRNLKHHAVYGNKFDQTCIN